ncbi:hypothetical protein [Catenuloplanes atrovinosus]|uniref:Uncharacterized protein n=1 Tax=Catenuloplanes atrovinosus TaxID=137266 RepID=A0AAE3YKD0_9ACTN|nr:hypothetical protein [Catenuloplanes atrovinosus]MDR7275045.1 hypothetical protein [Catenuloplanes atrovinosus]
MKRNYVAWAALALSLSGLVVGAAPGAAMAKGSQVSLGGVQAPEPSGASLRDLTGGSRSICVNIQVEKTGWQGWRCGRKGARATAGAAGTTKKARAVAITANGVGTLCVKIMIQSAPVQSCVSDRTVLVAGSASGVRLDTLQVKTSGSGVCGNSRSMTAAWSSVKCAKAGQWLAVGRWGANAVGLSV